MIVRAKIQLLLAARRAEDVPGLLDMAAGLAGATVFQALPRAILGPSPQGASGADLVPFDAVIELTGATHDGWLALAEPLAGFGDVAGDALARDRCGVIAGLEHHVMPGTGAIALICPLVRLPALDRAEFQDYWLNHHAEFGRRDPAARYRQLHQDAAVATIVAELTGLPIAAYDGVAEAYFADVAELAAKLASPEIAEEAFADEQRFIDHARSYFLPFEGVTPAAT